MSVSTFALKPSEGQNTHVLDHAKGRIVSDSHYVFPTLARRVLSLNLALSGRFVRLANFCFKTPAGIKILPGNITFCSLAHVA